VSDWITTASDGYCLFYVSQNSQRHDDKWPVGVWPCPCPIMCATLYCAAGPERTWHVSRSATGHLPVSRHRQATLCIQCLDWVHQSDWPAASRRFPTLQHPQWLLLARHSCICRTCATVDEQLFNNICHNQNHVLYSLPPPSTASQNYDLRLQAHSQQLPQHTGHLTDSKFITRMLFTDIY